ncbi:MAG: hypothetical protein ACRCY9_09655 [Phycicoccus sp.]
MDYDTGAAVDNIHLGLSRNPDWPAMKALGAAFSFGSEQSRPQQLMATWQGFAELFRVNGMDMLAVKQHYLNVDLQAAHQATLGAAAASVAATGEVTAADNARTRTANAQNAQANEQIAADNAALLSEHDDAAEQPAIVATMASNEEIEQGNAEAVRDNPGIEQEIAAAEATNSALVDQGTAAGEPNPDLSPAG